MKKNILTIHDNDESGHYASTIYENEYEEHSQLLGPNGKPLQYKQHKTKLGFDLTRKSND